MGPFLSIASSITNSKILKSCINLQPLFDIIHTKPGPGKSTFWAGSGFVVHRLAAMNANYVTLENTFPAIAMDGTSFCPTAAPVPPTETAPTTSIAVPPSNDSSPSSQLLHREAVSQSSSIRSMASEGRTWELDKPCTGYTPSNITVSPIPLLPNASYYDFRDAYGAWWQAASIRFAQEAVGTVNVVYESAPEGPTFCPGEYFGSIEMPALNTTTVTSMRVLVATHPDNPVERCGSGSFLLLRKMAEVHFANSSNFKFSCVDDPFDLTMVRCVRSSQNDPYCKKLISRFYPCPSLPPIDNPTTLPNIPSAAHPTAPMPITAPAVGPTSSPSNIPVVFHPTSSQCSVNCLSKTTFRFLLVGVSLATFFVGILTAVVAQTLIRHCKKSKSKNGQFTPSSSMKEIGYTSLLEDGLQGDQ